MVDQLHGKVEEILQEEVELTIPEKKQTNW